MRFGVKVQYKHIVVSTQINLKDYSSYSFQLILIKLGIYDLWDNALRRCVMIRTSTPGGLVRVHKSVNEFKFQSSTPPSIIKLR